MWKRCPKDVFVGRTTLEIGVASEIISFNDGLGDVVKVFSKLNTSPEKYTDKHCLEKGNDRINLMERKSTDCIKQTYKSLRAQRKGFVDTIEEKEGIVYGAGLFNIYFILILV